MAPDLKQIYFRALEACAPERLVAQKVTPHMPRTIVSIGKCAGALLDGIADYDRAFVALPEGYREPRREARVVKGGHPQITGASFAAGRALLDFVDAHDDILFLISGGGSACVELPLAPWFDEREVIDTNARLIASGAAIAEINCVRKHLSAIKGGRLGARVRGRVVTLVYSDVSSGALADVASGPTLPDTTTKAGAIAILQRIGGFDGIITALRDDHCPETIQQIHNSTVRLIADNATLTEAAAAIVESMHMIPVRIESQIEMDVADAARFLLERARRLREKEVLVAGGEPTVVTLGNGKGGRCSELAVRVALAASEPLVALFGSSDGADGNSGVAAISLTLPVALDPTETERALSRSNSFVVAAAAGKALTLSPTGNNLRDLYLLARS